MPNVAHKLTPHGTIFQQPVLANVRSLIPLFIRDNRRSHTPQNRIAPQAFIELRVEFCQRYITDGLADPHSATLLMVEILLPRSLLPDLLEGEQDKLPCCFRQRLVLIPEIVLPSFLISWQAGCRAARDSLDRFPLASRQGSRASARPFTSCGLPRRHQPKRLSMAHQSAYAIACYSATPNRSARPSFVKGHWLEKRVATISDFFSCIIW